MHLQPCEGGAQLMRGVSQEALLHLGRVAQSIQQAIERRHQRRELFRNRPIVERLQMLWRSLEQLVSDALQRAEPVRHAEPCQRDGDKGDQQRWNKLGCEYVSYQMIAFVERLSDLNHEAVFHPHRGDANPFTAMQRIEKQLS